MLQFNFDPFPTITTDRLLLRQITSDDANEILSLRCNKEVMQYLDRDPLQTTEEAVQLIQKITDSLESNDGITWGIELKTGSALIGTIGFWRTDKQNLRAEIGYMLHPAYQRKGVVQEALTMALDYAFNTMHVHSIEANVNKDNVASMKLLEKNNFVKEAHFRENYYYNGQFLDSVIYSLLTPRN